MIKIDELTAVKDGDEILHDVSVEVEKGERVLLMGPNGSGKTSLANVIMGDPSYEVVSGTAMFSCKDSEHDLLKLSVHERARLGIFVAHQLPVAIPGVSTYQLLYTAYRQVHPDDAEGLEINVFEETLGDAAEMMSLGRGILSRSVNEDFSGGEKKKLELLQMIVMKPVFVVLDEPDSGLDADSVRLVSKAIDALGDEVGMLLISHDPARLEMKDLDKVLLMKDGTIAAKGDSSLIDQITKEGYDKD